ncbi:MAG: hypothetical protein HY695_30600 [Deltaproteobacteria bacterium]|nr:hypothetical protein [Deltaproteobacteria bacterium]
MLVFPRAPYWPVPTQVKADRSHPVIPAKAGIQNHLAKNLRAGQSGLSREVIQNFLLAILNL